MLQLLRFALRKKKSSHTFNKQLLKRVRGIFKLSIGTV